MVRLTLSAVPVLLLLGASDGFSRGPPPRSTARQRGAALRAAEARDPPISTASLVELPVMFASGETNEFDFVRWERHRSTMRYGRLIAGTFTGETTKRILPPLSVLFLVTTVVYVCARPSCDRILPLPL